MHCKTVFKHCSLLSTLTHIHHRYIPFISLSANTSQQFRHVNILKHRSFSTTKTADDNIIRIAQGVLSGNRRDLSRAITLIESTNAIHYKQAQLLLNHIYSSPQKRTNQKKSFRIGITGPPGAGKSTLVNELGCQLCDSPSNNKICVLPIDPSSFLSGGSILGDQTRMLDLFKKESAYVRPSPNRLSLGGVTDTTFEVCTLCETAGFDTIFVETVGVGQAEIEVANCVDMFILVITPTSGDDLQGLKRGIIEMADLIIVNKADPSSDMMHKAKHIKNDYQRALSLIQTHRRASIGWHPKIVLCSSLPQTIHYKNKRNIKEENTVMNVWKEIELFRTEIQRNGEFDRCRKEQSKYATWKYVWRNIKENVNSKKKDLIPIENNVMNNIISPREASHEIIKYIWENNNMSQKHDIIGH